VIENGCTTRHTGITRCAFAVLAATMGPTVVARDTRRADAMARISPGTRPANDAAPTADQSSAHRHGTPRQAGNIDPALAHARAVVTLVFGPVATRTFDVRFWDGTMEAGHAGIAAFRLVINRPGALRRMLLVPSELSIVEAYLSGDVDIEGELESAMGLSDEIGSRLQAPRALARLARHLLALPRHDASENLRPLGSETLVTPAGVAHDPARDRAAVRFHYDVGNDFYALWLDRRLVYSCAYFRNPDDSLDDAQRAKLDLVCRKLRLRPGQRLLDVGCGWGALILHAVQHYGVSAVGITLSDAQVALTRERITAAGLGDRCTVQLRDYRTLLSEQRFDRIASIGMIEHVGLENLGAYFTALYAVLEPGGLLLNHGITSLGTARPRTARQRLGSRLWRRDAFIQRYVFPDGDITPFSAVVAAAEASGFETRDVESLREHYARTLRAWVERLMDNRDRAVALTNERVFRIWRLYMAASAHGFARGRLNVVQTLFARPGAAGAVDLPMTRDDLFAS
jgi:cyclopropane-fatty-acyl-phospholipid synthase